MTRIMRVIFSHLRNPSVIFEEDTLKARVILSDQDWPPARVKGTVGADRPEVSGFALIARCRKASCRAGAWQ
jgi:hypothetical protein